MSQKAHFTVLSGFLVILLSIVSVATEDLPCNPAQCLMCPPGSPGPVGPPGQQGLPGRDGRDGRDQPLTATAVGNNRPAEQQPTRNGSLTGVTYVHWGKNTCSDQSELVYAGFAAGKRYNQKGSGTNHLCLHGNPTFDKPTAGRNAWASYIYASEYEGRNYAGIPNLIRDSEISCSVCRAKSKLDVLMIPGVNSCPEGQGWTEEYHGYLMSSTIQYSATDFICVDHETEGIHRTGHDNDGNLLHMVEGRCGSNGGGLPCPPYVDGYEITCVVCSA